MVLLRATAASATLVLARKSRKAPTLLVRRNRTAPRVRGMVIDVVRFQALLVLQREEAVMGVKVGRPQNHSTESTYISVVRRAKRTLGACLPGFRALFLSSRSF